MAEFILPAAQGFAVVGASFVSGYIWCFSQAGVLTLRQAPADVGVRQFKTMYNKGKSTSPLIVVAATLCNAYSAYRSSGSSVELVGGVVSPFALYVTAAVCLPAIIPFTLLVMEPGVNRELIRLGTLSEKGMELNRIKLMEHDIQAMLVSWKGLNYVRAALVGAGALISGLATWHLSTI
ncbi:uncharacterized protein RCC_12329 [Ramularia collo-cygni]|uniref:DUF1772 family protein n=1 Tax=Ramularia collo-cygni TaxID=112498 RepID=A0A2D3V5C6_9PEZI|nr:uncharacterized protein RCC_12329 [Ramularia collo-cygni]CZT15473.1 uncharacterized protein RCC_12329 [Ramularia collo-cygni]